MDSRPILLLLPLLGAVLGAGCTPPADGPRSPPGPADSDAEDSDVSVQIAGSFTVQVPSDAAPDGGVAVRVFHPASDEARYPHGAPVVVHVPGGHDPGQLYADAGPLAAAHAGVIEIQFMMPGGVGHDAASGGVYDHRGPDCQQALVDVLRYASGELADLDGQRLTDRVPFAADNLGLLAISHGGNLALTTLAAHDTPVDWLVAEESPVGDQFVVVELGGVGGPLNPFYEPGSCETATCPLPDLPARLEWDPDVTAPMTDPSTGGIVEQVGQLYVDLDGDGSLGEADLWLRGVPGPGPDGLRIPKAYLSTELVAGVGAEASRLFADWPRWLGTPAETTDFWLDRDGSFAFEGVYDRHPELLIIAVASDMDHVQGQPDHPHIRSQLMGAHDAGLWYRLNPDAAYLAAVTDEPEDVFPDNAANHVPPYPGIAAWLLPDRFDGRAAAAAVLELADRTDAGVRAGDLDAVLHD